MKGFKNTDGFPFTELMLLRAKSKDSWNDNDTDPNECNLIPIVCTRAEDDDFAVFAQTFIQIAKFLTSVGVPTKKRGQSWNNEIIRTILIDNGIDTSKVKKKPNAAMVDSP